MPVEKEEDSIQEAFVRTRSMARAIAMCDACPKSGAKNGSDCKGTCHVVVQPTVAELAKSESNNFRYHPAYAPHLNPVSELID